VGGFSKGGSSASKRKRYARVVMSLDTRRPDHPPELTLCFTSSDLEDVFPHEDDPMVIIRCHYSVKGAQSFGRLVELD